MWAPPTPARDYRPWTLHRGKDALAHDVVIRPSASIRSNFLVDTIGPPRSPFAGSRDGQSLAGVGGAHIYSKLASTK